MTKQSFKLFAIAIVLGTAVLFGSTVRTSAQSKMTFSAPFEFQVGGETFSAGSYELVASARGRFVLRAIGKSGGQILVGIGQTGNTTATVEKVVFNRYGNRYFLREIFSARGASGVDLGESSAEREVRRGDDKYAGADRKRERIAVNLAR